MTTILLLALTTFAYAGYNLFIKVSGGHVPANATTTITATICLQLAALSASLLFTLFLASRGGQVLQLSRETYFWAAAAGLSIGVAEIAYFYLFSGIGGRPPLSANLAIPTIVAGTVVVTALVAHFVFREGLGWVQWLGAALVVSGILLLFVKAPGTLAAG